MWSGDMRSASPGVSEDAEIGQDIALLRIAAGGGRSRPLAVLRHDWRERVRAKSASPGVHVGTEVVAVLKPDRRGEGTADRDVLTRASRSSAGGGWILPGDCRRSAGVQQERPSQTARAPPLRAQS
eukprot:11146976-Alexandrium_andersonii.AAC.1